MNEFEKEVIELVEEFKAVQEGERAHQIKAAAAAGKLQEFTRKHNLPETFTLPEIMMLAIRRARA